MYKHIKVFDLSQLPTFIFHKRPVHQWGRDSRFAKKFVPDLYDEDVSDYILTLLNSATDRCFFKHMSNLEDELLEEAEEKLLDEKAKNVAAFAGVASVDDQISGMG